MSGMANEITNIVPKGKGRLDIFLDGEYRFSLAKALLPEVRRQEQLSEARIEALLAMDRQEAAYQQALRLLALRPQSERELRRRYAKRGVFEVDQDAAIDRLKDEELVDDAAFAQAWIDNRMAFRPRAAWALRSELRGKGVENEIIEVALENFDEHRAAQKAAQIGARKYKHLSSEDFRRRLSAYLQRRGFGYQTISPLIAEQVAELDEESEGPN